MEKKLRITKYFAFSLELLVVFVLQGVPKLFPPILGNTPLLLMCVVITIAAVEEEITAMIFGFVSGALIDVGVGGTIGYFTIILGIVCFFISFMGNNIFITNLLNVMVISFFIITAIFSLHFFLFHYMQLRYANIAQYYLKHYLVRSVYTWVWLPVFYGLNMMIKRRSM